MLPGMIIWRRYSFGRLQAVCRMYLSVTLEIVFCIGNGQIRGDQSLPEKPGSLSQPEKYLDGRRSVLDAGIEGKLFCIPRESYPSQEWTCLDQCYLLSLGSGTKSGYQKEPETWEEFQQMILAIIDRIPRWNRNQGMTASDKSCSAESFFPKASLIAVEDGGGAGYRWVKDMVYINLHILWRICRQHFSWQEICMIQVFIEPRYYAHNKLGGRRKISCRGKSAAILISGSFENKYENIGRYWKIFMEQSISMM